MSVLFQIETDRVELTWRTARSGEPVPFELAEVIPGRFAVRARREGAPLRVVCAGEGALEGSEVTPGPRLFEQTDYAVYARARGSSRVELFHRDPVVCRDVSLEDGGQVLHGYVNFGSQVGRSEFSVLLDGRNEFDFEIEVFPTKLDYALDYDRIVGEVQTILTSLALEYLRATRRPGRAATVTRQAHVEWLSLLQHLVSDLERAFECVAQRPVRGLVRAPSGTRAGQIKRIDPRLRADVRRGAGRGALVDLGNALLVRERLTEHRARPTLDTPEHRWLARQLERIRSRSAQLRAQEAAREPGARRERILRELGEIETRTSKLLRLEPLASAEGDPPAGFASMQLLGAPGYREAYQACLALALGLQVEQGPVALSVKDISTLYEYWCYLTVLRVLSEETGHAVPAGSVLSIRENGLHVDLRKGRESTASFDLGRGRRITVAYNPRFQGDATLVSQKPDLVMTVDEPGWPALRLLIDAKYRIDASPEYVSRYGAPGPPEDALNVLHRYRDAILEGGQAFLDRPKRTVIQAVVVYPYREGTPGAFEQTKLWQSLDRIGVGAVPLLPSQDGYLRAWLRTVLGRGGWALADRTIAYRAQDRSVRYRAAASEPVLIGRLYRQDPARHLAWMREQRCYYVPLARHPEPLQCARWVAVYSGKGHGRLGAVTHVGAVESFEVLSRGDVATPWRSSLGADELCVVYSLRELLPLARAVPCRTSTGKRHGVRVPRWTSRLALDRATVAQELYLTAEDDWRLFEALRASGVSFRVRAGAPAWFVAPGRTRARRETNERGGFVVSDATGIEQRLARAEDVVAVLTRKQTRIPSL